MTAPEGLTSIEHGAALSHPRPEILALTGLRGLAAVIVVVHYIGAPSTAPAVVHNLIDAGSLGVPLFFLLSGFALAYNYPTLALWSGRRMLGRYAMARIARLAPLTLVVGAAVLVLGDVNGSGWTRTVFGQQAWFLSVMVILYAAFPVLLPVVAAASRQGNPGLVMVLAVAFGAQSALWAVRLSTGSDAWLYRNPLTWIPDLVIGMTVAFLVTGGLRFRPGTAQLIQAGCLFYGVVVTAQGWGTAVHYGAVWAIPLALVVLTIAASSTSWTTLLLSTRFAVHLGVIGLALYLIEPLLLHGFGPVPTSDLPSALLVCGWIGFGLAMAEGAHRYVGVPGRRWLMALARRLDRRTGPAGARVAVPR